MSGTFSGFCLGRLPTLLAESIRHLDVSSKYLEITLLIAMDDKGPDEIKLDLISSSSWFFYSSKLWNKSWHYNTKLMQKKNMNTRRLHNIHTAILLTSMPFFINSLLLFYCWFFLMNWNMSLYLVDLWRNYLFLTPGLWTSPVVGTNFIGEGSLCLPNAVKMLGLRVLFETKEKVPALCAALFVVFFMSLSRVLSPLKNKV